MSLFPGYAPPQDNKPSTSREVKKEDPEDEQGPAFTSFSIARAAKEKAEREKRNKIVSKLEIKKDKAAVRSFNMGDTSDEDELTMTVDRSESEDENTRRIYAAQREQRIQDDMLEQRKKRNKERERARKYDKYDRYSRHMRENRSSSSDSDRKPKKIKKEEKDRYIKPEPKSTYDSKSKNWHFMATAGVTVGNPNSYMMDERRPDPLLKAMEKTEPRESAHYDQRFTAVLGAPYKINKLFFPAKTASRTSRILDKPIALKPDPEIEFLNFKFEGGEIALSTVRCDKQIKLSEEPTEERVAARTEQEREYEKIAINSDPVKKHESKKRELLELTAKRTEVNAKLRDEPNNEELWMQILRLEDQINKLSSRDTFNAVAANERKEAILKKALTNLPKSSNLIVEMMKLKKKMDYPVEELNKEWKAIMNRMPNSLALWQHRLNEMKHDSKQFNKKDYMAVMDQATADLKGLVTGTMKSHKLEPGTLEFLVDLVVLRVRMELAMGYIERAISTAQVLIECNIFSPPISMFNEFVGFKDVWEKNYPLVGEPGGKGWFHYRLEYNNRSSSDWMLEIKEASEKYLDKELVELGRSAQKVANPMVIFARHERLHEQYYWRPVRAEVGEAEDDDDRKVELHELQSELYPRPLHLNMAVNIVKELGGLFYGKMLPIPWEDPTGPRLFSFGLLDPSLHCVPVGLPQFIDRLLHQMAMDDPLVGWIGSITMSTARIRTQAWFIAQRNEIFDMTAVMKELYGTVENGVLTWKKIRDDSDLDAAALFSLVAIYEALNLFHAHYEGMDPKTLDKAVKTLVKQITSKASVWSSKKPLDQIDKPMSRSIVLILATLLVRLPGSWEERRHRVECVLLGKDAKTEALTLKEQTEVQKMVTKVRTAGVVFPDRSNTIHGWLSVFFGFDVILACVIDSLFLFANATISRSRNTITPSAKALFRDVVANIATYPECFQRASVDHYEQFYMYYIQILKYGKNEFRPQLNNALLHHNCPTNTFIVREFIESQQKVMNEVSMLADLKRNAEDEPSLFNSLSRIYAHQRQFTRVVASAEMQSDLAISQRVLKVFIDEAKRNQDPLLWRYALRLAAEFKNRKLGEEVFTQAFADCSWSRALHLDYMEQFPEGEGQRLPMIEKHIRIRGDPADVQTYIDLAKKVDGKE